jgi:hypothetical protein
MISAGKKPIGLSLREAGSHYRLGEIHWLDLAPILSDADNAGEDTLACGLDKRRVQEILNAYRLLQVHRPEWLKKHLDDHNGTPPASTFVQLLNIYKKLRGNPEQDKIFSQLMDDVLELRKKEHHLRLIIRKMKAESSSQIYDDKPKTEKKKGGDGNSLSALDSSLTVLSFTLDRALETNSHKQLRSLLGDKCRELAVKLNCIADAEFRKAFLRRKEGVRL